MEKVAQREFDMVLATPPCNTFTRAVFANRVGSRPIRGRQYPRGFPWLESTGRQLADEGNSLADFTVDVIRAATATGVISFVEFPEDFGKAHHCRR